MRPLRLTIKGFSTFAAETVIDFDNVELLAFVGPTGSGKSSIIDAMTFALYGSVARYDEKAVAPVINATAVEAKVQLDFEVHGVGYTVVRVVKRTTKGGATTKEARLESNGESLAGSAAAVTDQVRRLLGLDFGQFNKTVVLPQGKFSEFMHETPANRQALLRELFGFVIYARMGSAASERAKAAKAEAAVLAGQLAQIGDVSPERFEELHREVQRGEQLQAQVEAAAERLMTLDATAKGVEASFGEARRRLGEAEAVEMPEGVDELDEWVAQAVEAHASAVTVHASSRTALDAARAAVESGPNEAVNSALLVQIGQRDAAAAQLEACEKALAGCNEQVDSVVPAADAARATIEAARVAAHTTAVALEDAETALTEAGDVSTAREWVRLHGEQAGLQASLAVATHELEAARAVAQECEAARDDAADAVEAAKLLAPAALLAAHLHAGDACPVCQQVVVTVPKHRGDGAAELKLATKHFDDAKKQLDRADAALREIDKKATGIAAKLELVVRGLEDAPDAPAAAAHVAQLEVLIAARDSAKAAATAAAATVQRLESDPEIRQALTAEAAALDSQRDATIRLQTAEQQLAAAQAALVGQPDRAAVVELLRVAKELADARATAEKDEASAAADLQRANDLKTTIEMEAKAARATYTTVRDTVVELKPPKPTESLADDWKALSARAAVQCEELQQRIADLEAELAGLQQDRLDVQDVLEASTGCEGTITEIRTEVTRRWSDARNAVQIAEAERERGVQLAEQIEKLQSTGEVAAKLGQLLKSDGFERWLMEEALRDLVARATLRLKELTGGGYSLVVHDGVFRVTDHRNADEERDARSLSGGETFLTSLSLALALAEISTDRSSEGTARMDSIFLDEGFGTLDPETLDVVAGTIEELGASGRMVGVVTHIRELAERMPTRFEVTKQNTTSVVQRVDV